MELIKKLKNLIQKEDDKYAVLSIAYTKNMDLEQIMKSLLKRK